MPRVSLDLSRNSSWLGSVLVILCVVRAGRELHLQDRPGLELFGIYGLFGHNNALYLAAPIFADARDCARLTGTRLVCAR